MSVITSQQPIRFCIDALSPKSTGVVQSLDSYPVNLARAQKVTGITVSGSQPSGTHRYIAFKISGLWGRLTSSGTFSAFTENSCTFENLEEFGNTPEDLAALTNIPALAGKTFGVAIGLSSDNPDNSLPACALAFKCKNDTQQLTAAEYSPVYQLGDNAQLIALNADTEAYSGGSVNVLGNAVLADGTSTGWVALENLSGLKAQSIQLRGDYKAQTAGVSTAKINSASILYSTGGAVISDASDGEILTLTQDWYMPVKHCRLTVRHCPLTHSEIKAYAAFRDPPQHIKSEQLGVGSGARKTFQLAHTQGIKYDSFTLYYDSQSIYSDYELNCEAGRVTCNAPEGVIVSCDYEYGWSSEDWHEMAFSSRLSYEDYDQTEYRFTDESGTKSVAALRIVMKMSSGSISNELLGAGTGTARSYKLSRRVKDGVISVKAGAQTLAAKNWTLSDNGEFITAAAGSGTKLYASYDWISETPKVYQFAAVFSQ